MKKITSNLKKSANTCAYSFILLAFFFGFLVLGGAAPAILQIIRGESDFNELLKNLGALLEFLFTAVALLMMSIGLFGINKTGKPFAEKNVKSFKLSGKLMSIGGFIGSVINVIATRYLPEFEQVEMEGMGVGLILCGEVIVMFVDFLRYGSEVQDELDSIA